MTITLTLSRAVARRVILGASAAVALVGLGAEVIHHLAGTSSELVTLLSLSYEANLPTWYSSILLFSCAAALLAATLRAPRFGLHWGLLATVFLYISLDEMVELHERLNPLIHLHGLLYFGWIIPVAAFLVVLLAFYVPFLVALDPATRRRFVVAGAIYVAGALLVELPLGWWTERAGDENLVYGLIDWVEESMEIFGVSLFLLALLDHLAEPEGR